MIEEMSILATEQENPLIHSEDTATATTLAGMGNSFFSVQTGEDFEDVDILGTYSYPP